MKKTFAFSVTALALVMAGVAFALAPTFSTSSPDPNSIVLGNLNCGTQYRIALRTVNVTTSAAAVQTQATQDCPAPTTTTAPPTTTSPPEPTAIAGQGYHLSFNDEFDTLDRSVWDDHIWYDEAPHADWPNFQTVHDGELDLNTQSTDTYSGCTSLCYPMDTVSTLSSGHSFQYGYFEARMKWTGGDGTWPAFWLMSTKWAQQGVSCPGYAGEIDMMEGMGDSPNDFYGTVHSDSACSDDQQNSNNWQPMPFRLADNWHTYAALWTPTTVTWYVDDQQVMSAPTYANDNQPMFILFYMWPNSVGGWGTDPNSTSPTAFHTEVDWVRVWQQ